MPLFGNTTTFPVTDLLQWVETARRSGVLTVRTDTSSRCVVFREGRIVACSSSDPPMLLGQFLLARGLIDEETLAGALARHEAGEGSLGSVLVASGAVSQEDLVRALAAKGEETLFGLFDLESADFELVPNAADPPNLLDLDMEIRDVLMRGARRCDEMRRIREVFPTRGVVLGRTDAAIPPEVVKGRVAGRIVGAINGERTIAEVLLHARASQYLVYKFLFELHRKGFVEVLRSEPIGDVSHDPDARGSDSVTGGPSLPRDLAAEIAVAQTLLERDEPDAALSLLQATVRAHPGAPIVRRMMLNAESAYQEQARAEIDQDKVPVLAVPIEQASAAQLSPGEAYLVGSIDGRSDIRSILWIVPMRAVDVLRALRGLHAKGIVTYADPQDSTAAAS